MFKWFVMGMGHDWGMWVLLSLGRESTAAMVLLCPTDKR